MKQSYEARLQEYLAASCHPDTARNIGAIVSHSYVMSAEGVMAIILELELDHARKYAELASQQNDSQYVLPVLERTDVAQLHRVE